MTFTIITVGPRAALLAAQVRSWQGLQTAVLDGLATTNLGTPNGSALVLVDDDRHWETVVCSITNWLAAEEVIAFIAVVHTRPVLSVAAWDSAARLNYLTQTPVIWPVDGTDEAQTDLLHSYASAMAGWGNYFCFDVTDLAAIATTPCVGMFGRWTIGGDATEFARRYGREWGPPPRAGLLTLRAGQDCNRWELERVAASVMELFSTDDDFLITSNIIPSPDQPTEALLTAWCGPRRSPI